MRSKEVDDAIERGNAFVEENLDKIGGIQGFSIKNGQITFKTKQLKILLNYISELEEIVDVMKPSEIAYRIKLAENYLHKDEIIAIKEECKKEGCCSDELKEYYDNKCVRICKYYEVCKRVDKLLGG